MSILIPANVPVTITVRDGVHQQEKTVTYKPKTSLEAAIQPDETLKALTRDEYVSQFKQREAATAAATLAMCRVVYEAKTMLNSADFEQFCKKIGYRDDSSTIRKFTAIGKAQPRLIALANQLPAHWSSIYLLTQIPSDDFEAMLKDGRSLRELKGKELKELVNSTKQIDDMTKTMPKDSEFRDVCFAKLYFQKLPDDTDWRAVQKALAELSARLPIRFAVNTDAQRVWTERRNQRYEATKTAYKHVEMRPELWDLGANANAVEPTKVQSKKEIEAEVA